MQIWLGIAMLMIGIVAATITYLVTKEGEYPFIWWVGWGVAAAGILVLTTINPVRANFLGWALGLGTLVLVVSFLVGKFDDEYLPSAWLGVSLIACTASLWIFRETPSTPIMPGIYIIVGIIAFIIGRILRSKDQYYYDLCYSLCAIAITFGLLLGSHSLRTPLENLNESLVPQLKSTIDLANRSFQSYNSALQQAQKYRDAINKDLSRETANVDMADNHINSAKAHAITAQELKNKAGKELEPYAQWSPSVEKDIQNRTYFALQSLRENQKALNELSAVGDLFRLLSEWTRTIIWTEMQDWWSNEDSDSADGQACYYGESVSTLDPDGKVTETLVDDNPSQGTFVSDSEGINWKLFTYDDYISFVNAGLIPEKPGLGTSPIGVAQYLCGSGGVFNDTQLPITIVKEYGTQRLVLEDESDTFVGNDRYGTWCVRDASGHYQEIPQPQNDVEWCWFQPKGKSTNYYYIRVRTGNTWIYHQGPRRCIYCTPRSSWNEDTLVSSSRMSEVNGTDKTSVRGPQDIGGGPGTGK